MTYLIPVTSPQGGTEMNRKRIFMGVVGLAVAFLVSALAAGNASLRHSQQSAEDLYQAALLKKEAEGDLNGAIKIFQDILTRFPGKRDIAAKSQLQIGLCYEKLGLKEAEKAFQKVISDFPEQQEAVKQAREKLSSLPGARAALEKGVGEMKVRKVWEDALDFTGSPSPDGRFLS